MQRNLIPDLPLVIAFGLLYLLLPTANPSLDAWGYAADIRWNGELWSAHHLLYNAWGRLLTGLFGTEHTLRLMQANNAVFATAALWCLRLVLQRVNPAFSTAGLLFAGASFGFMRFAVENETYIMPLFFGMAALLADGRKTLLAEVCVAVALALSMLFHQTYIFWWLAFLLYRWRFTGWKSCAIPFLALPMVVLAYTWAANTKGLGLLSFVLHDVYAGGVATTLSWKNFLLTPVSFLRSFVQVHGYIGWSWLHDGWFMQLCYVATAIGLCWLGFRWLRTWHWLKVALQPLAFFALWAATFHLLFAFYSEGNAEFMVMLPMLLVLLIAARNLFSARQTGLLAVCVLCWNLQTGIGPGHFRDFYGHGILLSRLVNSPDTRLVSEEPVLLRNMLHYQLGVAWRSEQLVLESPGWAIGKGKATDSAVLAIRTALKESRQVWYCDHSRYLFNRARATAGGAQGSNNLQDFFQLEATDSFNNMAGKQLVYRLKER